MVVPVIDHAPQQIGPAEKRAVGGSGAADHYVVAAAGSRVLSVEHELLGSQAGLASQIVKRGGVFHQFVPAGGGLDVHLNHAWIGRDFESRDTGIVGWRVAFDRHGHGEVRRRILDGGDQVKIVREVIDRGHEDEELRLRAPGRKGQAG